jgi:hypothetical protein
MNARIFAALLSAALIFSACGAEKESAASESCPEDEYCEGIGLEPDDPDQISASKADDLSGGWPAAATLPAACTLARPLEVFFTPDDPVVTLELSRIDRVVAARQKDPAEYAEGENPFRIRYAVYNLSHAEIVAGLIEAERSGVDVQVLIEADQVDKPWNTIAARFERGGLEVLKDYRGAGAAKLSTADLVGIKEKGLMHLKLRLFETPEERAVLTGSYNPNQSAGANEENLHLIRDGAVIDRYAAAYDSVLHRKPFENVWEEDAAINVLFTPEGGGVRAAERILDWLEAEQEQILLMVFSLRNLSAPDGRNRSLVGVLKAKVEQGVPVYVITDRKQSDGVDLAGNRSFWDDPTDDLLRDAGVPVYEAVNDALDFFGRPYPYAAMHHKAAVLGLSRIRVISDASNWTVSGLGSWKKGARNVESTLFVDTEKLDSNATGRRYLAQWMKVLERYGEQSVAREGELPPEKVFERLRSSAAWPSQPVSFSCEAHAEWGEALWVVGSHDALGRWGEAHDGIPLLTDDDSYPGWGTENPVSLPLNERFEWKLMARGEDGATRWEGGDNRVGLARPSVCGGVARAQGSWQ